jgi:uncharacterized protein YoxC
MNTILMICAVVVTLSVVAAVVYLIQALNSVKKAADELEVLLKSVNREVDMVTNITGKIQGFVNRVTAPWKRTGGWLGGIISSFVRYKQDEQRQL